MDSVTTEAQHLAQEQGPEVSIWPRVMQCLEQVRHVVGDFDQTCLVHLVAGETVLDMIVQIEYGEGGDRVAAKPDVAKLAQFIHKVLEQSLVTAVVAPLCAIGARLTIVIVGLGDG